MPRDGLARRELLALIGASAATGVAGCVDGYGDGSGGDDGADMENASTDGTGDTGDGGVSPGLSVSDVETDDRRVEVPSAAIDQPGWLVVHPEADGGGPNGGVTLATRQLDTGEHDGIELTLTAFRNGQTLYAMLHYDDPDDGQFTFPEEGDPAVTTNGEPLVKPFTVTVSETVTPALSVTDQETDGASLRVPRAAIDQPGWLVIHPEADGGGPNGGVTLATRELDAGFYRDITMDLDDSLSATQRVYAMLHYDDPDDGEFTFPEEGDPAVTADGNPLVKPFEATVAGDVTPSLTVTDQETDGSSVSVPSAAIDQPGWLVIHPEAEGGGPNGGVTLATRELQPGTYSDVSLQLDQSISETQTLYAMLHYDDPDDGQFTFPDEGDPAVTTDGDPLVKPFQATVSDGESGGTKTVDLISSSYDPIRASVEPGTTVEWVNQDGYAHDVTSDQFHDVAEQWDYSAQLGGGETASYTFESSGIYEYYCTIHGRSTMCGAVLVGDVSLDQDLPCE